MDTQDSKFPKGGRIVLAIDIWEYSTYTKNKLLLLKILLTPLILELHLLQAGARNCSKQYSQYRPAASSTNPMSCNGRRHWALTQTKCSGHQILPKAVIKGPLKWKFELEPCSTILFIVQYTFTDWLAWSYFLSNSVLPLILDSFYLFFNPN